MIERKAGCDGDRSSLEEQKDFPTGLWRDMHYLEKQLICEGKEAQLGNEKVCKAAVKSAIISPPSTCPK